MQPVIVLRAVFCRTCKVSRCVLDRLAAQAGLAYSITDLMDCL